ncbi:hypothetical protein [Streptosporangium sp. NBC_01756]|uniref:hypothetical protein n=1 Tax=Streptosporangium sp. NBC_01756 TaxID=2975950 RepID=UPI002DDB2788|nr:hypothetical protein [Streptosporangium sp. NBC_01756]WSC85557.1 hypothetical protein OIE48_35170 [Streptosporangium sp. NBC_01756]
MTSGPVGGQYPPQSQWQQPQQPPWQQPAPPWNQQPPHQSQPPWNQQPYQPQHQPPWHQPAPPPPTPPPPRRKTWLWITLSVLAVLLTVGTGVVVGLVMNSTKRYDPFTEETASADPNSVTVTKKDLEGFLQGHTEALNGGDLKAYTKIFDQKNTALLQQQTRLFNNLRKLPLTQMSYQTLEQQGRTQDSFGRGVTFTLDVAFVHRFEGIDLHPVAEWYRWTVSKPAAGAPLVVTKVGGAPAPLGESKTVYYPGPWDIWPDISVVKTARTVVLAHPSLAAQTRRVAPIAEQAAANDLAFLAKNGERGSAVPKGFVVALVRGSSQLGNLFRKEKATEAGVSIPMPTWRMADDGVQIGGSRVVMDTASTFFTTAGGTAEIFRHEFAHSAVTSLDSGRSGLLGLDNWIVEGFAEYVANRGDPITADVRYDEGRAYLAGRLPQRFDGRLPDNFAWDTTGMTSVNYLMGHLAMRLIEERYGERKLVAFVTAHYRGDKSGAALQKVLGVGEAQFQQQWADYVRSRLG